MPTSHCHCMCSYCEWRLDPSMIYTYPSIIINVEYFSSRSYLDYSNVKSNKRVVCSSQIYKIRAKQVTLLCIHKHIYMSSYTVWFTIVCNSCKIFTGEHKTHGQMHPNEGLATICWPMTSFHYYSTLDHPHSTGSQQFVYKNFGRFARSLLVCVSPCTITTEHVHTSGVSRWGAQGAQAPP